MKERGGIKKSFIFWKRKKKVNKEKFCKQKKKEILMDFV